jgi:sigma-B regulation protein RsbU (phosphoserine phosphatase)
MSETHAATFDQAALEQLLGISAELLSQLDLDRLLESIMAGAADLLDASQINLYRYLQERDLLVTWIPWLAPHGVRDIQHRRGDGAAGTVLATGRGLRIDDYDRWLGRSRQWPEGVTGPALAVPVRRAETLIAVITAARPPGGQLFTDEDLGLLQLFANQAAVGIANAQLHAGATRRAEELSRLYDTSLDLVSHLDLSLILAATLDRAAALLDSRDANLRLYDPERDLLVPFIGDRDPSETLRTPLRPGEGLSGQVFVSGQPAVVNDYDAWTDRSVQIAPGSIARVMTVPLRQAGEMIGVLAVNRPADQPPYSDDDLRLLGLFANQASIAITNARQFEQLQEFHRQQIEKERLDVQLRTAQAVQAGLLPAGFPSITGWQIDALWRPALQLGGDYYDILGLAAHRWGFLIADVSDKGVPAALLMAVARSLFHVYASDDLAPSEVLARINRDLVMSSHSGMFVTALYAVVDTDTGVVRVSAAGHPPALVLRTATREVIRVRPPGMPLGIFEDARFADVDVRLNPADRVLLYTDGVTEASTREGEQFGVERLQTLLGESSSAGAHDLIQTLDRTLKEFAGEAGQSDDIAALVFEMNSPRAARRTETDQRRPAAAPGEKR